GVWPWLASEKNPERLLEMSGHSDIILWGGSDDDREDKSPEDAGPDRPGRLGGGGRVPQDAGPPAPAADGADAPAGPLHGRGAGRGVRHPQPHGLRAPAADAAVGLPQQRERGPQGVLPNRRAAPGEHPGLRRGTVRRRETVTFSAGHRS